MWYVEEFLAQLRSSNLSERTVANYRRFIERMTRHFDRIDVDHCRKVTENDIHRYLETNIGGTSYTPGWKYVNTLCIRRYFHFLAGENIIFAPPRITVKNPRVWSDSYPALDELELRRILVSFPAESDSDILAKTILETAYSSALRSGEIRALKLADISFSSGTLFLEQAKGKKDRIVPVGKTALFWIKRYVQEIRPRYLADPDETHLFVGIRTGRPIRHRALSEFIKERLRIHGLPHVNIHQLRASAATHMVNAGMTVGYAQHLLGHQDLATTKTYVQVHQQELRQLLTTVHPRLKMDLQIRQKEAQNHDFQR